MSDTKIRILKFFGNKHNLWVSNFKNLYEGTKVSLIVPNIYDPNQLSRQ